LYQSFNATQSLAIAERYATERLIADLLEFPAYKAEGIREALDSIDKFVAHFRVVKFAEAGGEVVRRLRIVATTLRLRKAKDVARFFSRVAELYTSAPVERLQWLRGVAGLANSEKVTQIALQAYVRSAAVIYSVLLTRGETDAKLNFDVLGLDPAEVKVGTEEDGISVEDFSVVALKRTLQAAGGIAAGKEATVIREMIATIDGK
jgi:hypothetical protein